MMKEKKEIQMINGAHLCKVSSDDVDEAFGEWCSMEEMCGGEQMVHGALDPSWKV